LDNELKVMLFQLPSALADGSISNQSLWLQPNLSKISIILFASAKANKEFILFNFG